MIIIVNPESFEIEAEEWLSLKDICRMAIAFSGNNQILAGMLPDEKDKALALAKQIAYMPIRIVKNDD